MKVYLLLISFLAFGTLIEAAETNELYATRDFSDVLRGIVRFHEATKTNRECLPAKDFPEGNWGESFRGFQLSLRLDNNTYTNSKQVTAIVLVRNITTNDFISGSGSSFEAEGGPVGLMVTTDKGQTVEIPPDTSSPRIMTAHTAGSDGGSIYPHTQHKYLERLNSRYALTNGDYFVQAVLGYRFITKRIPDGKPLESEWKQITSALVPIKIEEPKKQ
jgi:hypothetical protein